MAVTPRADAAHFRSREEERELASALDEVFDITFGKPWNSRLSIWLGQPKRKAQQRFGLRQEVLIVYCPYRDPDSRIKRTIEEVAHDPEFKHRIEKFLVIVIDPRERRRN